MVVWMTLVSAVCIWNCIDRFSYGALPVASRDFLWYSLWSCFDVRNYNVVVKEAKSS